jgi:Nucleotidyl transferase AbiEii toxin, Type IV TA system
MFHTNALAPGTLAALKILMNVAELSDRQLVGGTGLALYYGHRISIDIDLFSKNKVDSDLILAVLPDFGKVELLHKSRIGLHLMFNDVKTDIIWNPFEWICPTIESEKIRLASLEDIAAMKVAAVTRRATKKDFYDLYYLMQNFSGKQILGFYQKRYPNWDIYAEIRSLCYFDEADEAEMPIVFDEKITWNLVKKTISKKINEIRIES